MNKILKIVLNILVFLLIAGFIYYMIFSMNSDGKATFFSADSQKDAFVSPYSKISSFNASSNIICFSIYNNTIFAVLSDKVSTFDISGKHLNDFRIFPDARDIVVEDTVIYLLYPTRIDSYSFDGKKVNEWGACSYNSDYCSITSTESHVYITDVEHKLIWQLDKEGMLVRSFKSPDGFIIPGYSFDIICINDTVYCANSGRHKIESYSTNGEFIASFGISGAASGAFAGCCNPVYLEKSFDGSILTSEKGNPRISSYGTDGAFRSVLFDGKILGGGTNAYKVQVSGENIYIANKKAISVYQ